MPRRISDAEARRPPRTLSLSNTGISQGYEELFIMVILVLFVLFGSEKLRKGRAVLLTEGIQNLRLDGHLTLIAKTNGKLGELMTLTRFPEPRKENIKKIDMKTRYLRPTLNQNLLQQNCFGTGEDKTIEREEDMPSYVGGMPLLTDLCLAMSTDPLAFFGGVSRIVTVVYGPE